MKKIGIVTHYYKSRNYGGVLQAFALTKFLTNKGHNAEQICYRNSNFLRTTKIFIKKTFVFLLHPIVSVRLTLRIFRFYRFRKLINHSKKITDSFDSKNIMNEYNCLITGSDQVWHPNVISDTYCLNVKSNAIKISYAASVATNVINENISKQYKTIDKLDAISLREQSSIETLKPFVKKEMFVCCDPVFLHDTNFWNSVIKVNKRKDKKYIFCYFLGKNNMGRAAANYISQLEGYQIIYIPHIAQYNACDTMYIKKSKSLVSAGPTDFLACIQEAELILTDSFHAAAFSLIFNKKFICFQREEEIGMESRISDLLTAMDCKDRLYLNNSTSKFDKYYKQINFENNNFQDKIENYKKKSIVFLENSINGNNL